ncbi:hypothetical protein RJ640_004026 [Escallonia rubra]|uniref:Homeobox domain-containing protein n=1 Tax=Escallonia rubra TaxID=112253 RepID=A0AA88QHT4_9ASTE|nr:hypothetical protein RJ640_004026 [Escallonia rubra]
MATYYHGSSEIQADGLQTLYLMNPDHVGGYYDTQHQAASMLFLNPAPATGISHAPPFLGVPLPTAPTSTTSGSPNFHDPRFHYNLWHSVDQTKAATEVSTQLGFCSRPVVSPTQQGLSLRLSPQRLAAYRPHPKTDPEFPVQASSSSVSVVSNGVFGVQSVVLGSKYLKAAQQLLDEVVTVGNGNNCAESVQGIKETPKVNRESMAVMSGEPSYSGGNSRVKSGAVLTSGEKQELQKKKAKLVSMLEELEQRYRQHNHQMQMVVNSFEQAAGLGSAKSYTALALQTISKKFRCLKDAICSQIKARSKSFGAEGKVDGSRLKFVDHQLRQQRALQQLGMMQQNAWRPQRGLPERAVSVLRAWLFEHFLHPYVLPYCPTINSRALSNGYNNVCLDHNITSTLCSYPKDSDKHMLAKQTGLTRSQVSNWFINARVRLWKPMVEDMYTEETKDQEQLGCEENTSKRGPNKEPSTLSSALHETSSTLKAKQEHSINPVEPSRNLEGTVQRSPKKARSGMQSSPSSTIISLDIDSEDIGPNRGLRESFGSARKTRDIYPLAGPNNGFGAYASIEELARFTPEQYTTGLHGNGNISLTLGLPQCENISLLGTHQNYQTLQFGSRLDMENLETHYNGANNTQPSHSNAGSYETINIQSRKRFAAEFLHDSVT